MTNETKDRIMEGKEYRQQIMDKLSVETSAGETFKTEENKDLYVKKLEKKIESLKSILDDLTAKSGSMEKSLRTDIKKDTDYLKQRYENAKTKAGQVRNASEDAWKELRQSASTAWDEFASGIETAISKFK